MNIYLILLALVIILLINKIINLKKNKNKNLLKFKNKLLSKESNIDKIFSRELEALANSNDILISITTSGDSNNIFELIKSANKIPIQNWCLTSHRKSKCSKITKTICTPEQINDVANIQELHIAIGHLLCMRVEFYFYN